MTYKKIVVMMLEKDSQEWVSNLLNKYGTEFMWLDSKVTLLENNKKADDIMYEVEVSIIRTSHIDYKVVVGGTVDDMLGICHSVIWDENHNIIWMSGQGVREELGITSFKIA